MTSVASTADTLVIVASEDAWEGDAEFAITVDGIRIGGIFTVTALNKLGQTQDFTIQGDFGAGAHTVGITFLNDAYGGTTSTDRNLYLDALSLDGTALTNLDINVRSTTTKTITAASPPPGTDTLTVNVSEDAWQGNAQFVVLLDGVQIGGTQTATALRSSGATQNITLTGNFGAGSHTVAIKFINDAWGGSAATDRNLYVNSVTYDGTKTTLNAPLYSNGSTTPVTVSDVATVTTGPVIAPPTIDTLVLYVSEDYYEGNAQFSVTVDGKAVGGTLTATGLHSAGGTTPMTLTGAFGPGPHTVVVTFLNDANGGSSSQDRNLYVSGIDYNGVYTGVDASLYNTGSSSTTVVGQPGSTPVTPLAPMSPAGTFHFTGVNLSGLEGNTVYPGTLNTDYVEPTHAEIDYYASEGMNVIRLPFDWERLQPTLNGPLNQAYLSLIDDMVHYAATKGITVDLDVHNYGSYYGNQIGTSAVPDSAFANLWSQIATHYASQSNVMFDLMNEPQQSSATAWLTATNDAIAAIRATGAGQEILVSGIDNSGGMSWTTSDNATVMEGVVDPKMNFAFDIHQYLDPPGGGLSAAVVSPTIGVERLTAVTQWAEATGNRLFLGEFGSGSDSASLTAMQNMLNYLSQNTNVWQGVTEWAGGPWWGNYFFNTDPVNGVTTPQINLLHTYT